MAYPKRRETDEQAEKRIQELKERNEAQGADVHGNYVDDKGKPLKNFGKDDLFRTFGR